MATQPASPARPDDEVTDTPRRGRPPRITRDEIVRTAIALGRDDFTMHGIAEQLGVTTPALYSHVSGRKEILDLITTDLMGELRVPVTAATRWQDWLLQYAREVRLQLAGAGVPFQIDLSGPLGARRLRAVEPGIQLLTDAGFLPADVGRILWLVFRVALTAGTQSDASVDLPLSEAQRVSHPDELPATQRAVDALASASDRDTFDFDLQSILFGLERRLSLQVQDARTES